MKNLKLFIGILLLFIAQLSVFAQPGSPTIPQAGKPMPGFTLTNIRNFKTKTASLKDFRGKWLFLDFWNLRCSTCVHSFGEVDDMNKKFNDKLTWLILGMNDSRFNKGIEEFYDRFSKLKHLTMPAAFDSTLCDRLDVGGVPHIFMIDPNGILYGISNGQDFTVQRIQNLLNGKTVDFRFKETNRASFDPAVAVNQGNNHDFVYCTVLSKWNGEGQYAASEMKYAAEVSADQRTTEVKEIMVPLFALYDLAYLGSWSWNYGDSLYSNTLRFPILELSDTSRFIYSYGDSLGKGLYNFYQFLPGIYSVDKHMKNLQEELKRSFGYQVTVEKRPMLIWKLEATADAKKKLKSNGGPQVYANYNTAAGFTVKNISIRGVLSYISMFIAGEMAIPFIDETGITDPVDFSIVADMTRMASVQKALEKKGLRLVKAKKEMSVVVIRDAQNQ